MSNLVLPALIGQKWGIKKTPMWKTKVQTTSSGRELRSPRWSYPIWRFSLGFEVLRQRSGFTEYDQMVGFYNQIKGMYESFLYDDPYDNTVTAQAFGIGNASTRDFVLVRNEGGFVEPIVAPKTGVSVYINGALTTAYTVNYDTGVITFNAAPANGAVLTWTGGFYFRCRFTHDDAQFTQMFPTLWDLQKLEFQSVKT